MVLYRKTDFRGEDNKRREKNSVRLRLIITKQVSNT